MAIGHWASLTECQKLTNSQLIPGVIEEDVKRNPLTDRIPVAQSQGKSVKFNREKQAIDGDVAHADIGEQLSWTGSVEYVQIEVELKRLYIQRILDNFVPDVYGNVNNYEAQVLIEMKKGMMRALNDKLIYDDLTYGGSKQFDGLHAFVAEQLDGESYRNTDLCLEMSGALSLAYLRKQHDAMLNGIDFCYIPYRIARRVDAAYQEAGLAQLASATAGTMGMISYGVDDMGKRVMFFDGVPFLRNDYLMEETADTGQGSDAKAKAVGGASWSLFNIKLGDVFAGNPGLCLAFGNTEQMGDFYKLEPFDKLEDFDAKGFRLINYSAPLLGSSKCLARIDDITDAAIVY